MLISIFISFQSMITIRVSNSLDPDQARLFVWPDLGPNYLQRLSADDTRRQKSYLEDGSGQKLNVAQPTNPKND